jgi:hypothetical protein
MAAVLQAEKITVADQVNARARTVNRMVTETAAQAKKEKKQIRFN